MTPSPTPEQREAEAIAKDVLFGWANLPDTPQNISLENKLVLEFSHALLTAHQKGYAEGVEEAAKKVATTPSVHFGAIENMKDKVKAAKHLDVVEEAIRRLGRSEIKRIPITCPVCKGHGMALVIDLKANTSPLCQRCKGQGEVGFTEENQEN